MKIGVLTVDVIVKSSLFNQGSYNTLSITQFLYSSYSDGFIFLFLNKKGWQDVFTLLLSLWPVGRANKGAN